MASSALANSAEAGADTIGGGTGNDAIYGGDDNDLLQGEGGNDVFAFSVGSGGDVIGDFQLANDRMDVSAFFTSFAQAQANFSQVGNDGAINLGNGDSAALHNHLYFIANGDFSVIQHGALAMICRVVQGTKSEDNEVILAVTALHHHVGKKGPNKLGRYL